MVVLLRARLSVSAIDRLREALGETTSTTHPVLSVLLPPAVADHHGRVLSSSSDRRGWSWFWLECARIRCFSSLMQILSEIPKGVRTIADMWVIRRILQVFSGARQTTSDGSSAGL